MNYLAILSLLLAFQACTPLKRAQTGLARGIAGSVTHNVDGHEVYCSEGKVCAEIDVLSIQNEGKDVTVKIKNRTGNTALIQVRLQILDRQSNRLMLETRPENMSLPPTQEKYYKRVGIYRNNAKIRVLLNIAY